MHTSGRLLITFVSLALLSGCKGVHSPLEGVWEVRENRTSYDYNCVITVFPNGDYVSQQTNTVFEGEKTNAIVYTIEGNYQVRDGLVIDYVKKHSSSQFVVPDVFMGRIVSFDANQLCLTDARGTNNSQITVLRRIRH
jgi:Fe-S cluster assembly iron-binding protein IscA